MSIIVPASEVVVKSTFPLHSVRLNEDVLCYGERLIPRQEDIVSFILEDIPEHLVKVHVYTCGNMHAMTFEKQDLVESNNLFPQGFPMSLVWGVYVDLKFEYDKNYVEANEVSEMVDEYEEVVEHSDTEEEFYDRWMEEYRQGFRVHRKQVPTGRKVSKVIKGAKVMMPRLIFNTIKSEKDVLNGRFRMPVWDTITIHPDKYEEEHVQQLIDKYKLHIPGSRNDILEMLRMGKPFEAKIENILNFGSGAVGKVYYF